MLQSENINELAAALSKAQGQIVAAIKDKTNPHFKSNYADLASVWEACRQPLSANGLAVVQSFDMNDKGETIMYTTLSHSSGQWIRSILPVRPERNNAQGIGSAITYMRRYALAAMVGVVPDEDDDGESAAARPAYKPGEAAAEIQKKSGPTSVAAACVAGDIPPPLELFNSQGEVETVFGDIEEYLLALANKVKDAAWWFDVNEHVVEYIEEQHGAQKARNGTTTYRAWCGKIRKLAGNKPGQGRPIMKEPEDVVSQ